MGGKLNLFNKSISVESIKKREKGRERTEEGRRLEWDSKGRRKVEGWSGTLRAGGG